MKNEAIRVLRRHLRSIEREMENHLKSQTACCGVTLAQCHALLELAEADGACLADLSGRLKLDASTLSRTVDGLVRAGYVSRVIDPGNRRSVRLGLTPEGKKKVDLIDGASDRFLGDLMASVPSGKQDVLVEAVGLLAEIFPAMHQAECFLAPPDTGGRRKGGKRERNR